MKLLTLLLPFFLSFNCLMAQNNYSAATAPALKKFYVQAGGGGGSHSGINAELGLQAIINNKWSTTLSYHSLMMKPGNLPEDYRPGWGYVLFIPYTDNIEVNMKLFSLTAGKYLPIGRSCWFTGEAGFSIVSGEQVNFKPAPDSAPFNFLFVMDYPSNYTSTREKKTAIGGMLRADFNWAFSSFLGLGGGVFANFNSIQAPIGYQVKLILGWMRREKK